MMPRAQRFVLALAALSAVVSIDASAVAADPAPGEKVSKKVCVAAAERGQELRDAKQMRDARGQFALCARPECPSRVSVECKRWLAEAEAALASIRLEAVDGAGKPITTVRVSIDGKPWTDEISRDPIFLDPGSHEVRFEHGSATPVSRAVTLAMGERDRVVHASLIEPPPAAPAPAAPAKKTEPAAAAHDEPAKGGGLGLPIALMAVGVVSLGAAGTFWLLGNAELSDVKARCTAGCPDSEADGARRKHLIGDIALGVGVVSVGVATVLLLTRSSRGSASSGTHVAVTPMPSGVVAGVRARF